MKFSSSSFYEIFPFKLKINNIESSFVYGHKPPIVNNEEFLDHLDSIITNMNLSQNLFVFGDINMNW